MNQTAYPGQLVDACQVPNCHCHCVYSIANFHLSSTGKLISGEHVLKHAQQDLFSLSPLIPDYETLIILCGKYSTRSTISV